MRSRRLAVNYEDAEALVDAAISDVGGYDLRLNGDAIGMPGQGADRYVELHRHEYIRTVGDIMGILPPRPGAAILELGAFFGVVSTSLSRLGYDVTAADMPDFIDLPEQADRYRRFSVKTEAVRLEDFLLPFADETFEAVIMCETLEHLNFNPLPLLKEINRIGTVGSVFYLSLPNAASLYNRAKALRGEAIGVDVESFFRQLEPGTSEIVNDHWREYTASEIRSMLERLGYRVETQYYFSLGEMLQPSGLRSRAARVFFQRMPWLKENQTTIARKETRTGLQFRIPATVHRTLRSI